MTSPSIAVFGSGIAALVSAGALAERGAFVHLIAPGSASGRPFGGHFAGCSIGGERFDLGMLLLEFTSFGADPGADAGSYNPGVRGDVGRFAPHVRGFIEELGIETRETRTPSMLVEGKLLDDLIIADRLSSLASLDEETRTRIRRDLEVCVTARSGRLHRRNRHLWSLAPDFSLRAVSLANHGPTFHDLFIEPLCRKLTGAGTASLAGKYHRAVWLPLFHPETLRAELDGDPQPLPPTLFHYPTGSGFHAVVEKLEERIRRTAAIEVADDELASVEPGPPGAGTKLRLKSGREIDVARVVWSLSQETLLALDGHEPAGDYATASIGFAFLSVATESVRTRISTLHVVDDDPFFYRVTDQTANSGAAAATTRMVVEYNVDERERRSIGDHDAVRQEVSRGLEELGILDPDPVGLTIAIHEARGALGLPTPESVGRFDERNRRVREAFPEFQFVGASAAWGCGSLSDQIVQGMKVGRSLDW